MAPQKIIEEAVRQGIDIIAICDHNSAKNVRALVRASEDRRLVVIPGLEVCTSEESHIVTLFGDVESALELQAVVYANLRGENDPDAFGPQVIADEYDEVVEFEKRLLIGATELTVEDVVGATHRLEGLAIAAHIDRESYSVIGQLGFIPPGVRFDALELSQNISDAQAATRFQQYQHYTFVRNSDAHCLADIGKGVSEYFMEEPSFKEIAKALNRREGRGVLRSSDSPETNRGARREAPH